MKKIQPTCNVHATNSQTVTFNSSKVLLTALLTTHGFNDRLVFIPSNRLYVQVVLNH